MSETISAVGRTHLRWALVDGVGPITFGHLLRLYGDAETAWGVTATQLRDVPRVGARTADQIAGSRDHVNIESEVEAAATHGLRILCMADAEYPEPLKRIPDPPIVLYVRGQLLPTDAIALAIVGTRRCSIYGSEQARRFGELLAQTGFTVVSGLARGIDAFAHHGAVDVGGRSIAVLGSGLVDIYPPENRPLAEKLLERGAWVSELPVLAEVRRENFPSRNRIIAGLSLGTLVVEAPRQSGALITARLSSEYNREVFVIPGRAQDPNCAGSNALIRDMSAKLVMEVDDILHELGELGYQLQLAQHPPGGEPAGGAASEPPSLSGAPHMPALRAGMAPAVRPPAQLTLIESRVLEVIGFEPVLQDVVLRAVELPAGEVLAAFTSLEIKRLIKRLPGQLVMRYGTA